jgi:hypothetical protein
LQCFDDVWLQHGCTCQAWNAASNIGSAIIRVPWEGVNRPIH